jgi:tetratricopeptide (TPR) repeat protein
LVFLLTGVSFASGIDSLFYKANAAYNNQYYEDAINNYQKIVDAGYESADLYYNLGNAFFKNDEIPSAILYYEKALKLKPNDEDIRYNLDVANTRIVDRIEPMPELFYKRWWRSFYNMFTANTWAKISTGGFILFIVLLSFYLLSKRIRIRKIAFFTGVVILFITLFAFAVSFQKYQHLLNQKEAIVFTPTITVKSSPNPNSVDLFVIHEGSKVEIRDKVGSWYEIRIANGSVGWLPESSLKSI